METFYNGAYVPIKAVRRLNEVFENLAEQKAEQYAEQGPQGETGETGPQGPQGESNLWFVNISYADPNGNVTGSNAGDLFLGNDGSIWEWVSDTTWNDTGVNIKGDSMYQHIGNFDGIDNTSITTINGNNSLAAAYSNGSIIAGGVNNTAANYINNYCTISGGFNNSAIGSGLSEVVGITISGGQNNSAIHWAAVGGGGSNTASGYYSVIGGGSTNTASGTISSVGGGAHNSATGYASTVGGGYYNSATGNSSTISGGGTTHYLGKNIASGTGSTIIGGLGANAPRYGQVSHASGAFAAIGDAQHTILIARTITIDNTPTTLKLDGNSALITIENHSMLSAIVNITGTTDSGSKISHYIRKVSIKNSGLITSLVGSVSTIGTDVEDDAAYDVTITADDANDALDIKVTGKIGETIQWIAVIDAIEIHFTNPPG